MSLTSDRTVEEPRRPDDHNVVTRARVAEHLQRARYRRAMARVAAGAVDPLLPLRATGGGAPLFCAHPVMGLGWCYVSLLPHLDAGHPVYALQSLGLRRPEPLPATLAEAARDFADRIRLARPAGPYHLLGWSLGGNLAFAVAEELERRGCEVGLLTVLDSAPVPGDDLSAADDSAWRLYNFVLVEFGYVPSVLPEEAEPEARALAAIRERRGLGLEEWPEWRIKALLRIVRHNVALAQGHRPGRVRCPVLLVSAAPNAVRSALPDAVPDAVRSAVPDAVSSAVPDAVRAVPVRNDVELWRPFVDGPIHTLEVPCEHQQLMLPDSMARVGPAVSRLLAGGSRS